MTATGVTAGTTPRVQPAGAESVPLLRGLPSDAALTRRLLDPMEVHGRGWWLMFLFGLTGTLAFLGLMAYSILAGAGVWGNQIPVAWGNPIINFLWWSAIGHGGLMLSAILLLAEARWRAAISHLIEGAAIVALTLAAIFPALHLGRPWFLYWLLPYPSTTAVWPQFKSSLPDDVAAVPAALVVAFFLWYLEMLPDLATARDAAVSTGRRRFYALLALGWRSSGEAWHRLRVARRLLALLALPVAILGIMLTSLDLAETLLPAWHSSMLPVYSIISGLAAAVAVLLLLMVAYREAFRMDDVMTARHLDIAAQLLLGGVVLAALGRLGMLFDAWYAGSTYEQYVFFIARPTDEYAWMFWTMTALVVLVPQVLWIPRFRRDDTAVGVVAALFLVGAWAEDYLMVVIPQQRDFLPSAWAVYDPTWVDGGILVGSIGAFLFAMLLLIRFVPTVAASELKVLRDELRREGER